MYRAARWCAIVICLSSGAPGVVHGRATGAASGCPARVLDSRTLVLDGEGGLLRSAAVPHAPRVVIGHGAFERRLAVKLEVLKESPVTPPNPEAHVTGPVLRLTLPTASLAAEAQLDLRADAGAQEGEIALLGYERDGVWVVDEATPAGDGLRAVVPLLDTSGNHPGPRDDLTVVYCASLSLEPKTGEGDPALETYRLQAGGWAEYVGLWKQSAEERVALMIHGFLGGTRGDLLALGRELLNQPGYRYDAVYAVEWHEGHGIERIGASLARTIRDKVPVGQIDIFAHSMGGLVARAAIELSDAASKVNLLVTMGSPHLGHSRAGVLSTLVMRSPSWAAELADLQRGSGFLRKLNQPSATPCAYRLLAGDTPISPRPYWALPFSVLMAGANDGMVETRSAAADLIGECASYAVKVRRLNHAGIRSDGAVLDDIRTWLLDLYGGDRHGLDGAPLVFVPAGEFRMGADDEQEDLSGHWPGSRPVHPVRITRGFWIARCEVTSALFAAFLTAYGSDTDADGHRLLSMEDGGCRISLTDGVYRAQPGWERSPVAGVTWYGAKAYCAHYGLSLPTEAEWEYAARGPQSRDYPWGSGWDAARVAASGALPVGGLPEGASWCGALDMAGGVWEWCSGWFSADYYVSSPVDDPPGPESGSLSVLRGGGGSLTGRSAYRYPSERDQASNSGLRPVHRGGG